jgi:hypothetical protein
MINSPQTVGLIAITIPRNRNRVNIRFQNTGTTILYVSRSNLVSATNFEFTIPAPTLTEPSESNITTNSTSAFYVVSSAAAGQIAIFETTYRDVR